MSLWNRLLGRTASTTDSTAERAAWLDQVVRGAANTVGREIAAEMRAMRRNFDTADTPAWTSSWSTTIGDINATLASQLPAMRSRSIGLARNDEWAARWLIQADDNILGDRGITLTMGLRRRDGKADTEANAAYERFWTRWGQRGNCEVSGKLSWREIEGLLLRCEETCGEILYRHRPGSGPLGFRIQILPPQVLDVAVNRDYQGHRVRMGVEIDDEGVPTHYWLLAAKAGDAPTDTITQIGKHVRVPAAEIRHFFHTTEVGQVRGIPGLSVGARRLWLLHDFEEAAAVASSNAAKRQGFFVSPDGNAPPGIADTIVSAALAQANAQGKTLSAAEIEQITAAATKYATTMPGQFDTIPQGYDFRPFESKWPEVSAEGYIKQQIRGWAAARGASYHTLGNDLSDVNYSSAQVGIGDERRHFKVRQQRLLDWVHNDVIGEVLKRAALYEPGVRASRLTEALAAVSWLPPQWAPIDPLKANEADDVALRNKSTSRRRIWLAKGLDPDEMEREILEEEARLGPIETTGRTSSGAAPAGG